MNKRKRKIQFQLQLQLQFENPPFSKKKEVRKKESFNLPPPFPLPSPFSQNYLVILTFPGGKKKKAWERKEERKNESRTVRNEKTRSPTRTYRSMPGRKSGTRLLSVVVNRWANSHIFLPLSNTLEHSRKPSCELQMPFRTSEPHRFGAMNRLLHLLIEN